MSFAVLLYRKFIHSFVHSFINSSHLSFTSFVTSPITPNPKTETEEARVAHALNSASNESEPPGTAAILAISSSIATFSWVMLATMIHLLALIQ